MTAPDAGHAGDRNTGENDNMKIGRIARNLVWAENPKAGMFFAMTVVSFLLCVVAPALAYVAFAAPPIGKHAGMNWALIWIFTDDVPARLSLLLFLLLVLDAMVLTWSYYTALLRTVFASKRRYAVPLGFVAAVSPAIGLFGVVLPCAIKARVHKALLAFAAMTACVILAVAATLSDALPPELVVVLSLMAGLLHAAVLIHLPSRRVGRWAYAPAILPIALVAVLAVADVKPVEYQRGSFDIPWGSGERSARRVIGYRVFSRYSERHPRMYPGFTVWLGDAPADGSAESSGNGSPE